MRDLRHVLFHYRLHENRFGSGEDDTVKKDEDMRRNFSSLPLLIDFFLAMRSDPLLPRREISEFLTVVDGRAASFAFPCSKEDFAGGRCGT